MKVYDADAVAALGPAAAVDAIVAALRDGLDPARDVPRTAAELAHGQFLLMPSQTPGAAGVKVVAVAPDNPERGLPRIQATYLLHDADTLALRAVLDGTALTTLRTPAVSAAAVLDLLPEHPLRVAVVGGGPQATGHAVTLAAVHAVESTTYLLRDPTRAALPAVPLGSAAATDVLSDAHVVVCATSATTPVFDSAALSPDAVVIAVGSHEPDVRELDSALMGRAQVVVEDVATVLREGGDVVLAIGEGVLAAEELVPMADVVAGRISRRPGRPLVFKGVGMSWQDLVVAEAVVAHHRSDAEPR